MKVRPINYEILFEPDLKTFKFNGKEKITIETDGSKLVLNAADLKIKNCHVVVDGKIFLVKFKADEKKEELHLNMPKIKGKAELHIEFQGTLNDKLAGFYRSKYTVNGKEKYLATTQFEAADARRAFPCWDNPEQKATFDISVVMDNNLTAISNMPIIEKRKLGKKKLVKFARTPVMSTYLVYLCVGDLEFVKDKLGNLPIRIFTTPRKKAQGKLALEFAKKFLKFYNDYFRIKYPLPKLDFIALPDFAAGAMENWGAITFREAGLLYDPKTSSTSTKQYIAEVVSHEIAHQWFGDLVTMKWWNDLWLNESFVTFMANKSVDKIFPEWDLQNQFLEDSTSNAMNLDALKSSHPINVEVHTPSEISEIFDEISYDKGGSILRMLEDYLGENVFRDGLRKYLSIHKYGNATTDDLWKALEKISGKPVRKIMDTWVKQAGYPVVKPQAHDSHLLLTQERFLLEQKLDKTKWYIPLSIDADKKHLMKEKQIKLRVSNWTKINFGQKGFYRVEYPQQMMDKLKMRVETKNLPNVDRWGVENDMFAMAMAGEIPVRQYVDFVKSYRNEDDYIVCKDIADNLYAMYLLTSKEGFWEDIKDYNREFLEKIFNRLGWEPRKEDKHTDALLRPAIILQLGRTEDVKILEVATEKFDNFLKKPESLHADLRSAVYNLVAWQGDNETHDTLTDFYKKAKTQEEKRRFLASIAGFKDEKLLEKTLDFSLTPDVRVQDTFIPVIAASTNPYARDIMWPWVRKNWDELKERYSIAKNLLNRIIDTLSVSADMEREMEMAKFFAKHPARGTQMTVKQMLERLRINAKFLENIKNSYSNVY